MAKKILIGLGVVVALLAVALVALITFVDVNRFKPQIAQAVQDRYGRTLEISGDLSLTVFPRLGVALPKTTLSEPRSSAAFASVDGARVSVALLPLLRGRIEAGKVSVYGLTATVDKRADGSLSIDDLIMPAGPAPAKPTTPAAGGPPDFEIGGIELTNASLTYRDLAAKNTVTLSRLNLSTGRLAPKVRTPVELTTQFAATQPAAQGEFKLKGELDVDLAQQIYGGHDLDLALKATLEKRNLELAGKAAEMRLDAHGGVSASKLAVTAKGALADVQLDTASVEAPALAWNPQSKRLSVGGVKAAAGGRLGTDAKAQRFEATLAAPKIDVTETTASGERVSASIKLGGGQAGTQIDAALALEGLAGSASALKIDKLSLNGTLTQPLDKERVRRVVVVITSPVAASLEAQTLSLPQLAGDITMEDPALPQKSVKLPVTAALALDGKKERVDARFSTKFDETALSAEFDVRGFAPAKLSFEASADKLNLDRYFPPPKPGPGNDSADPKDDPKIDLSALKDLNLSGEARVGQLQMRGIRTQNLRVVLRAANGRLAVAPLTAALYGGSVDASAFAQADNRMGLDAKLLGVNIEPLLRDALDKDLLAGRGNMTLDVTTAGATIGALKRGLNGSGAIALRDGAIKGFNVAQALRSAKSLLAGGGTETKTGSPAEKTDFSELTASFTVKNGIAHSDDLDLRSPLVRVGGAGQVDLVAGTLDYTVRASVVGTLKGQDGRDINELRGVTVPVKLAGPFEKVAYSIDWGSVAKDALRSQTTEQLKGKLQPKAQDLLKGLLGR